VAGNAFGDLALNDKVCRTRFDVPNAPMDITNEAMHSFYAVSKGAEKMDEGKSEVLQGTLDLMVLKTLYAMGPLHGFGIARRIEQVSDGVLDLNEGTVYTALLRLQQQGWIASKWGTSENNRRARFYSITRQGAKQLERETENWERVAGVMERVLKLEKQG
jgi:PadR family transcriptional regulator, regulatory protein PadR